MTSISIQYTNVSRPNAKAMTDYFEGLGAVKVTCHQSSHKSCESPTQPTAPMDGLQPQIWDINLLAQRLDCLRLLPGHKYSDIAAACLDAAVARFINQA